MNFVVVIVVLVLAWMVYMYMQSYESISKELREIRLKCVAPASSTASKAGTLSEVAMHPMAAMKKQLLTGLDTIKEASNGVRRIPRAMVMPRNVRNARRG